MGVLRASPLRACFQTSPLAELRGSAFNYNSALIETTIPLSQEFVREMISEWIFSPPVRNDTEVEHLLEWRGGAEYPCTLLGNLT